MKELAQLLRIRISILLQQPPLASVVRLHPFPPLCLVNSYLKMVSNITGSPLTINKSTRCRVSLAPFAQKKSKPLRLSGLHRQDSQGVLHQANRSTVERWLKAGFALTQIQLLGTSPGPVTFFQGFPSKATNEKGALWFYASFGQRAICELTWRLNSKFLDMHTVQTGCSPSWQGRHSLVSCARLDLASRKAADPCFPALWLVVWGYLNQKSLDSVVCGCSTKLKN